MRNSAAALSILLVAGLAPVVTGPAAQAATQTVQAPCRIKIKVTSAEAPVYSDTKAPRSKVTWLKRGKKIGNASCWLVRGTSYPECRGGTWYYMYKRKDRLVFLPETCAAKV